MINIEPGDMLETLPRLIAAGVRFDSCVTDPPYHLTSIVKRRSGDGPPTTSGGAYKSMSTGFMGQKWDGGDIAFRPETWRLVFDALKPGAHLVAFSGTRTYHRMACAIEDAGFEIRDQLAWVYSTGFPKSHNVGRAIPREAVYVCDDPNDFAHLGTALKPAWEPVVLARKPLAGTVAANVLAHGTGALNIDGCRVPAADKTPAPVGQYGGSVIGPNGHSGARDGSADHLGRWPANLLHDGSPEVVGMFPSSGSGTGAAKVAVRRRDKGWANSSPGEGVAAVDNFGDSGSAARFFYSAKADASDRLGSKHPTVKPTDLMRWLVRLITPPGGHVLDCFAGSGSTGMACMAEGFDATLCEREAAFVADIRRRIAHVKGEDGDLFANAAD